MPMTSMSIFVIVEDCCLWMTEVAVVPRCLVLDHRENLEDAHESLAFCYVVDAWAVELQAVAVFVSAVAALAFRGPYASHVLTSR